LLHSLGRVLSQSFHKLVANSSGESPSDGVEWVAFIFALEEAHVVAEELEGSDAGRMAGIVADIHRLVPEALDHFVGI
jgi:hypothetical protein